MSYLQIGDYDAQLQNISNQISQEQEKDSLLNNIHDRANKAMELAGEAKAFTSMKPVGKYLLKQGGDAVKSVLKDAVDKAGLKLNEVRKTFQDTSNIVGRVQSVVNSTGSAAVKTATSSVTSATGEELAAGAGAKVVGQSSLSNEFSTNASVEAAETGERAELVSAKAGQLTGRASSLLDRLNSATSGGAAGEGAVPQPAGVLSTATEDTIKAQATLKANQQFDKTDAGEEETEEAEKAVGKKTGEKLATEEEEDLDATGEASADAAAGGDTAVAIPVLDIIGLAVGAGLALKAAFDKPKQLAPVDNINASYQIGI